MIKGRNKTVATLRNNFTHFCFLISNSFKPSRCMNKTTIARMNKLETIALRLLKAKRKSVEFDKAFANNPMEKKEASKVFKLFL